MRSNRNESSSQDNLNQDNLNQDKVEEVEVHQFMDVVHLEQLMHVLEDLVENLKWKFGYQKLFWDKKVDSGEITSIEEILEAGLRIQESGIIKKLLPDLKSEVVDVGIIQKMTSNGQSTRFKAIVAAGNENGYLGIGQGKSKQMRIAIEKAT